MAENRNITTNHSQDPRAAAENECDNFVDNIRNIRPDWRKETNTFAYFTSQINNGLYDLKPEHQREVVHTDLWKSEILSSAMFHGDLPDVYFHQKKRNKKMIYESLDGKQRSSAISQYMNNEYAYQLTIPTIMKGHLYKDLPSSLQQYLENECHISVKISNVTLSDAMVEEFFQRRQQNRKTSTGECLNACISSDTRPHVSKYLTRVNDKMREAGITQNGRLEYFEICSRIMYIFQKMKVNNMNFDVKPEDLISWFRTGSIVLIDINNSLNLIDKVTTALKHLKFKSGNSRKTAYTTVAWFIMKTCWKDDSYDDEEYDTLINAFKTLPMPIILTKVSGDHSLKCQRMEFEEFYKNST